METYQLKAAGDNLAKYDYIAKKDDFIEVSEWHNGEGITVTINERPILLTYGELKAINHLVTEIEITK